MDRNIKKFFDEFNRSMKDNAITPNGLDENICVISKSIKSLKELNEMAISDFFVYCDLIRPQKLYKYFPYKWELKDNEPVNYSLEALENNTVYLQYPDKFDDIFDSKLRVDKKAYQNQLAEFFYTYFVNKGARTFEDRTKALDDYFEEKDNVLDLQNQISGDTSLNILDKQFLLSFVLEMDFEMKKASTQDKYTQSYIEKNFYDQEKQLQNSFGVSCFTTSPFMNIMWSNSYANCHSGFCLEYDLSVLTNELMDAWRFTFPMIYCNTRPDVTLSIVGNKHQVIDDDYLKGITIHGTLRKSIEWAMQDEWRLCMPINMVNGNRKVKYFPISKVYLGPKMSVGNKLKVIEVCNRRGIEVSQITYDNDSFKLIEQRIV